MTCIPEGYANHYTVDATRFASTKLLHVAPYNFDYNNTKMELTIIIAVHLLFMHFFIIENTVTT